MQKRAKFNLSNFHNCTFKMGTLYPVNLMEVLPGDTIQMNTSIFLRLAPMVAPVMHPTYVFSHTFYWPSRLIKTLLDGAIDFDFEAFITGGVNGEDVQSIPQIILNANNAPVGSLPDAFGLPVQTLKDSNTFSVNMLPFAAYYHIWNEYYRDQDLQDPISFEQWVANYTRADAWPILQPCWSKDYFTTARPWPQLGPEVTVPVNLTSGGSPLITATTNISGNGTPQFNVVGGKGLAQTLTKSNNDQNITYNGTTTGAGDFGRLNWVDPKLAAETNITWNGGPDTTGNISINDLREGFAIQRFEEHRSLWGSRYEDLLRYLGVKPQDSRLQLPEYLGGFSSPVQFSEVLQTSAGATGGVGDLYGHGISAARGRRIRRFIPEHGYVITLVCVRPIPVYSQGIERLWNKKTKYDFWTRELEHIGQQEILNKEVYADGTADDANTFGFQNRYDEYRRGVSVVTGEFRTNQDFWTLARIFDNRPALNSDFVECNVSDRIFQVGKKNSDQLYAMVKNNVIARRLVSKNGNPI